jgi:fatty acid-binding protein DegV
MASTRRISKFVGDAGTALAIALLLAVFGGRVMLLSFARPAVQANTLLTPADSSAQAPARLVLVMDGEDAAQAARLAKRVENMYPDQPLEVRRTSRSGSARRRSREAGIAELARIYGYAELPILLTVSREGQVVRVQSLPMTE